MTLHLVMNSQIQNQTMHYRIADNSKLPFYLLPTWWILFGYRRKGFDLVCLGSLVLSSLTVSEALRSTSPHASLPCSRCTEPHAPGVSMLHWTLIAGPLTRRQCHYLCSFPVHCSYQHESKETNKDPPNAARIWPILTMPWEPSIAVEEY